ncbi:MAG TPA: MBOAT family O-acyltransferase [Smithella sp.]|nr:MBOAT family protein [Smithella sp.]HNY51552.1 MBOAT family O-acyltransferase [Smithella sp.]HQG64368.1 MBOAT family O-acyltransferase [Smithella sp.]HQI73376.1 MBOAT family O-acyltransferase [Smithella sp.]
MLPVILAYWLLPHRGRICLLILASYFFYGSWDARFPALLLTSTIVDFLGAEAIDGKRRPLGQVMLMSTIPLVWLLFCAGTGRLQIPPHIFMAAAGLIILLTFAHAFFRFFQEETRRKAFLIFSIGVNLTILGFFKYFNFFADSTRYLLKNLGIQVGWVLPDILMPVGISFFTFQTLAYVIDVYRKQQKSCEDFPTYAAYLSFFPQILAGPIGRAPQLMPQWQAKKSFAPAYLHDGTRLILVGLFKKIFVADSCALVANACFDAPEPLGAAWSILGAIAFTFQIYGDFSGYTDMARGSAKLFGIDLMINFRFPYLAKTPAEFWRRWHISLSTWFRDYVYIPLGGNRCSEIRIYFNLMITMLLAGLWHGAGNMFIVWGAYYGLLLILYRAIPFLNNLQNKGNVAVMVTFVLTMFGWVIFRSADGHNLLQWATGFLKTSPVMPWEGPAIWLAIHIAPLWLLQFLTRKKEDESELMHLAWPVRGLVYLVIFLLIVSTSVQDQEFIYFQF